MIIPSGERMNTFIKAHLFTGGAPVIAAALGAFVALAVSRTDAADRTPVQAQAVSCPTPAAAFVPSDPEAARRERDADWIYLPHSLG
jgi:hypothetical protein